jgi:hypothetical protein
MEYSRVASAGDSARSRFAVSCGGTDGRSIRVGRRPLQFYHTGWPGQSACEQARKVPGAHRRVSLLVATPVLFSTRIPRGKIPAHLFRSSYAKMTFGLQAIQLANPTTQNPRENQHVLVLTRVLWCLQWCYTVFRILPARRSVSANFHRFVLKNTSPVGKTGGERRLPGSTLVATSSRVRSPKARRRRRLSLRRQGLRRDLV